ncbi:MAG: hypothetical protein J6584_06480 [Lactobacillus sp.]|uniref:hypothetical protein n=1 Tax=Bombilactobacillus bombi TaxID=1303590 RepID=UPI0035EC87FA|nr:hypothetical protein [Lactobacillus sp.]
MSVKYRELLKYETKQSFLWAIVSVLLVLLLSIFNYDHNTYSYYLLVVFPASILGANDIDNFKLSLQYGISRSTYTLISLAGICSFASFYYFMLLVTTFLTRPFHYQLKSLSSFMVTNLADWWLMILLIILVSFSSYLLITLFNGYFAILNIILGTGFLIIIFYSGLTSWIIRILVVGLTILEIFLLFYFNNTRDLKAVKVFDVKE